MMFKKHPSSWLLFDNFLASDKLIIRQLKNNLMLMV